MLGVKVFAVGVHGAVHAGVIVDVAAHGHGLQQLAFAKIERGVVRAPRRAGGGDRALVRRVARRWQVGHGRRRRVGLELVGLSVVFACVVLGSFGRGGFLFLPAFLLWRILLWIRGQVFFLRAVCRLGGVPHARVRGFRRGLLHRTLLGLPQLLLLGVRVPRLGFGVMAGILGFWHGEAPGLRQRQRMTWVNVGL